MRAVVYRKHGSPDVLACVELERPAPGRGEVLLRVRAASINPLDWRALRGLPPLLQALLDRGRATVGRLGADVSGVVEAVGDGVARFQPGDAVFGACRGAFAEYACASQTRIALKPDCVTFEQAASVAVAGVTALQGLRDRGKVQTGRRILVNGASGGVGTFAVQIAKAFGAHVTGVCSTRNLEMVRSLGADRVIDYTREDFTRGRERYDVVLDTVGNHSITATRRALVPGGAHVIVGGPKSLWSILWFLISAGLGGMLLSGLTRRSVGFFIARVTSDDLAALAGLMKAGAVVPAIDRCYPLSEVAEAVRYAETGHARGKVVLTL